MCEAVLAISVVVEVGQMTCGSFLPFSVFLQALVQGVALIVNAIAEALAGLRASIIGASVRAL